MSSTPPDSVRPKTARWPLIPSPVPLLRRRFQHLALAASTALARWAEASARQEKSAAVSVDDSHRRELRLREAELRREAAVHQLLQMPRQF